jgi:mRNA interferase RelE/StbE
MEQKYEVLYTDEAADMLVEIQDRRVQRKLADMVDSLAELPESRGKALLRDLFGFRSIRAIGQRYRIVYMVDTTSLQVTVVGIGIRKDGDRGDIYEKMRRAIQSTKPRRS